MTKNIHIVCLVESTQKSKQKKLYENRLILFHNMLDFILKFSKHY